VTTDQHTDDAHCADRKTALERAAAARRGIGTRPAPTPVANTAADPGRDARHTRRSTCPAVADSGVWRGPCLCIGGNR
jgi:hypothetical protein